MQVGRPEESGELTYNFDADKWYENQRRLLELKRQAGTLDGHAFEEALADLDRRYDEMVARLDGSFQLPR